MTAYTVLETCQIQNLPELLEEHIGFKTDGRFVEVGAEDGIHCSNTWTLAEIGWKGLCFEPRPRHFLRCCEAHRWHDAVVLPFAVAYELGIGCLYLDGEQGSSSTLREELIEPLRGIGADLSPTRFIDIPTVTLDWALDLYGWEPGFDLLSVDVEGAESQVFAGFDLARWRPRLMIWELEELHPSEAVRGFSLGLSTRIISYGYRVVHVDMLNTVFVRTS